MGNPDSDRSKGREDGYKAGLDGEKYDHLGSLIEGLIPGNSEYEEGYREGRSAGQSDREKGKK